MQLSYKVTFRLKKHRLNKLDILVYAVSLCLFLGLLFAEVWLV